MRVEKQQLRKKTTFMFKWKGKRISETLIFTKLVLILLFYATGFSVSAQQTNLQSRIAAKNVGDTIKADSKNWCIIKKTTLNGVDYVFLLSADAQLMGPSGFGPNSVYQGSNLQKELNKYYSDGYTPQLKAIAVVPNLGDLNNQTTSSSSQPTAELAAGSGKTNILFAPSYNDIDAQFGTSPTNSIGKLPTCFHDRFWTRTPSSSNVYEVYPQGKALVVNPLVATSIMYAGGIWVRTTAIEHSISGTVYGLPGSTNLTIYYTIDNGSVQSVQATNSGGNKVYTIPNIPDGANVNIYPEDINDYGWYFITPSPNTNNVTSDITGKDIRYYETGFSVNREDYLNAYGKSYCENNEFTFEAKDVNLTQITWELDGVELTNFANQKSIQLKITTNGVHTIKMYANDYSREYDFTFGVGEFSVIWQGGDNEWNNPNNWFPNVVPSTCNTVYIGGYHASFPQLRDIYGGGDCLDIYFMYGGQLGRPDLLRYRHAYVTYNFGLSEKTQQFTNDWKLMSYSSATLDRMKYAATYSLNIPREEWRMLSSPLRGAFTGDFSFGGFPMTFLRKFDPIKKLGQDYYNGGNWTTSYTGLNVPVAEQATDGFAFYMYGYDSGKDADYNMGCEEEGVFGSTLEAGYLSFRNGEKYGIAEVNGILELPFFSEPDSIALYAHRTQIYNQQSNTSYFYHINNGALDFNKITDSAPESVVRENNDGNYRFVPESYNGGSWVFKNPLYHVTNAAIDDEFLVGNPYMSPIRMYDFLVTNGFNNTNLAKSYRIWSGEDFVTGTVNGNIIDSDNPAYNLDYVDPQQGFFIKKTGNAVEGDAEFNVEDVAYVRPTVPNASAPVNDKISRSKEKNFLRIKAENNITASYTVIAYREDANNGYNPNEDVKKLFTPMGHVPSIYSLSDEVPVSFNFINNKGIIIIPLGIRTQSTGDMNLTFTGMDNYFEASKIEFIDALENRIIDITEKSSYTYSFIHAETGIQNGRFSLRITSSTTSIQDVNIDDDLKIYCSSKNIYVISSEPVEKLEIYNLTGIRLFESNSNARYYPLQGNLSNSPQIVKVMTKSRVKTVKINYY